MSSREPQSRWHHLYSNRLWRKRSLHQRHLHPLCQMCEAKGVTTAGTLADHKIPHHGNEQLFFFGELITLCDACHSSTKRQLETKCFVNDIGP
ncbi:MAG: HNH endonuclease, partial [Tumebacillaceae bacterium]